MQNQTKLIRIIFLLSSIIIVLSSCSLEGDYENNDLSREEIKVDEEIKDLNEGWNIRFR